MSWGNPVVRRLMLIGVPVGVMVLGIIHPGSATNPGHDHHSIYHALEDQADLFIAVHLAQLIFFSLLALVVWHLTDGLGGAAATVSRVATLIFLVAYTAFDSVAGIAVGVLVKQGHDLPAADQAGIEAVVSAYQDSWITGDLNVLAAIGSGAWLVALVGAALALRRDGASRTVTACLALAGLVFAIGHPAPFGPIAMVILLVAIVRIESARSRPPAVVAVPVSPQEAVEGSLGPHRG